MKWVEEQSVVSGNQNRNKAKVERLIVVLRTEPVYKDNNNKAKTKKRLTSTATTTTNLQMF